MSYANFIFILFPQMVTIHPSHFKRVLPTPVCYRGIFKTLRLHRVLYLIVECVRIERLLVCPRYGCYHHNPHSFFVGITGLEPAPLFLTPVPKTGRIPITDYIPKYCTACRTRTYSDKCQLFYRQPQLSNSGDTAYKT